MTAFEKYVQRYIDQIPSDDWLLEMKNAGEKIVDLYQSLTEENGDFVYADGKWTLKEVLQHLIDAERIFVYRALRFSRGDQTNLPGWDEEAYVKAYRQRTLKSLIEEFVSTRKSSMLFFESLDSDFLKEKGIANGYEFSVETLGKLLVGHQLHHLRIIEERYLPLIRN